ncbi:MAG: Rieske 2Fe-2S domain-containing protein [bacterium]|nr:Rieske 2Fe-2S domain-containing protein [bacterium]MXZ29595.1 Rieske 2Fe-2S domain-containing protein [Acidimicrobiia bacterium]MDE0669975.1 Rieske 2Fe-2S domain-containing protein [bacterium]MYB25812.1 Rieske 2Fe-2S domain-containing protein [Acidimicrobiia bacterium]MYE67867.1 Rieske 2Fe-2S domain-containing protein [Acidimicrobiia bacterium]
MIVFAIVIPILAAAALVVLIAAYRRREVRSVTGRLSRRTQRRDRRSRLAEAAEPTPPTGRQVERAAVLARRQPGDLPAFPSADDEDWTPPDPEEVGVTRRQFLNRSIVGFMGLSLTGFGAAILGFLWPPFVTGFGAVINAGTVEGLKTQVRDENGFLKLPEGRMWVTEYPEGALASAREVYSPAVLGGMEAGLVALYWKCPHLGCTVPECVSSQWFECPCHGSKYNQVGEKRGGPAPRGMDHFATSVNDRGEFLVDTGRIIQGSPIGTNTTNQEAQGAHCIGEASE